MSKMMRLILNCVFSPRLYRIYGPGPGEGPYVPNLMERVATHLLAASNLVLTTAAYTSPLIGMFVYKRGFFSLEEVNLLFYMMGAMGCYISMSLFMRALGRASNADYVDFLLTLYRPFVDEKIYIESIRKYDFDFKYWPISYSAEPTEQPPAPRPFDRCANPELPYYKRVCVQICAYLAVHTFATRLIYPGSVRLLQKILYNALEQGRLNLVEVYNGKRARVITTEGNTIDTMFVDNRLTNLNGRILVICSEGNSGFYEVGIMTSPAKAGFSTLGWNHPGFGDSTRGYFKGFPFPRQEQNAIDAVVQYAINELEFRVEDIVMFGWSIGGYVSAWAASSYPDMRGLILDASFDDLLPIALNQMPRSWYYVVKEVVHSYMDLNIGDLLVRFPGPVQIVRRTEDEVVCLRPGQLVTNRANYLFLRLIVSRHPEFFEEQNGEKSIFDMLQGSVALSDQQRLVLSRGELSASKRRILRMIERYMRDYRSTHCSVLPVDNFKQIMDNLMAL